MKSCTTENCDNPHYGVGLCRKHYQRQPHIQEAKRRWTAKNREKRKLSLQKYNNSLKGRNTNKKYRHSSKGRKTRNAGWWRYNTRKLKAMPPWVDTKELTLIYRNCPSGYHVDHIMPLRGENSCGLHVPWNLQYLPAIENIKKGNKVR